MADWFFSVFHWGAIVFILILQVSISTRLSRIEEWVQGGIDIEWGEEVEDAS